MKRTIQRLLSILLSIALLLSLTVPALALEPEGTESPALTWEKLGTGRASSIVQSSAPPEQHRYSDTDPVRVSIVLRDASTMDRGWSTRGIADNPAAMDYRAQLKAKQLALANRISAEILDGEPLDVVWNITLAANIISANVAYGKLDAIRAMDEVKSVVLEARYEPDRGDSDDSADPDMYRSTLQTGSDKVWEQGITGAGSRVAVIDTGIEVDHISFSAAGLEHSLELNAQAKDMSYADYVAGLNLLTAAEIQAKASELNVEIDPDTTYRTTKVPYAYNYVDSDYDITHRNDTQGNHGSHVEGIAAGNKYVVSGSGFVEAASGNNKIKGQAYDAQILTMKVFGKNGGAYDSDYMVAIEDAIVLGADSVNLSLGSSSPGMATSPEYQSILNSLVNSDTVVSISMGNSYYWSYASGTSGRVLYLDDVNYYTGGSPGSFANAFTVASVGGANYNANNRYSMSSFSSWGVPSDLSLKPEITAPGGSITSVNGNNTTGYTSMSGTSMAAPQIAGIAALVAQYLRESGVKPEGLNVRQLSQSLIMSTAVPIHMTNNNYIYYPVLQQGAGLARVDKAITAKSCVLIDPESLPARAPLSAKSNVQDGKVKVELGDDPDYNGVYSFAFSLNNLTDQDVVYQLGADFFTQNITGSGNNRAKANTVVNLTASTLWTVNGMPIGEVLPAGLFDLTGDDLVDALDAQAILDLCAGLIEAIPVNSDKADLDGDGDVDSYDAHLLLKRLSEAQSSAENQVTVPARGSVKIGLTFDLKNSIDNYSYNGNYVEGYVNAVEITPDGAAGTDHSIPVLGYYGSWTDPSMFNKGSYLQYKFGGEVRTPYMNSILGASVARALQTFLIRYAGDEFGTPMGGNPVVEEDYYDPDRTAIAPKFGDEIFSVHYSALRNAAASRFRVMQQGVSEPVAEILGGSAYGAYYSPNDGSWHNTNAMPDINCFLPDTLADNTKLTLSFELAPEYYVKPDGSVDWDALHDGARLTLPVTVDNQAPEIVDLDLAVSDKTGATRMLVTAKDNQYIARLRILKEDGTVLLQQGSDPNAQAGQEYNASYTLTDDSQHYLVEVTDYALNVGTYRVNLNKEELTDPEITMTLDKTEFEIIGKNSTVLTATILPWGVEDAVTWTSSDPAVATVNGRGVVTGVETGTAVITATSVAYPTVSASATVHVRFIEKTLNGIVCDENGAAFVIEFNMRDLPSYRTLHEEPLSDWVYETAIDRNGTVYVSTYDGSSQSPLYTLDLETMELTQIGTGTSRTYYTDIESAGDALYGMNILLGVYSTNLYTINKATSARVSTISMRNYTGTGSIVGITFHKSEEGVDYYYLLTQSGLVYDVGLTVNNNAVTVTGAEQVLNFGYTADTNYWQDLYYDGENLYWSRIDLGISRVDLIMAENLTVPDKETNIIRAGSFAVDVWPIGGLFELTKVPGYTPPAPEPEPGGDTGEDLPLPVGSLNAVTVEAPEETATEKLIRITADEPVTNGFITVNYPATATLISVDGASLIAHKEAEGSVVIAYAYPEAAAQGSEIARLCFAGNSTGTVTISTQERNDQHPQEEPVTVELGGSDAPIQPEPVYTGPEWVWSEDCSMANAVFTPDDSSEDLVLPAEISVAAVDPDCVTPGAIVYTATVVFQGETYTDVRAVELEPLGHDPQAVPGVEPSCTEPGFTEGCVCALCGEVLMEQEEIPALGHDPQSVPGVEPSCTEPGLTEGCVCARCGEVLTEQEEIPALGHDPQPVAAVEPSCTEPGLTEGSVCARCGEVLTAQEIIPPTGHTVVVDPAVEPTCTEAGLTAGAHCSVCDEVLAAQEEIGPFLTNSGTIPEMSASRSMIPLSTYRSSVSANMGFDTEPAWNSISGFTGKSSPYRPLPAQ